LWLVTQVAEQFHVLPSVAARDLDDDPERLSLVAVSLLRYAHAKAEFDVADSDDRLKHWKGSELMKTVKKNTFELHQARIAPKDK